MSIKTNRIAPEGIEGFDWAAYEAGWDGNGFNFYGKPYINDKDHAAYCREEVSASDKVAYNSKPIPKTKELKKAALVDITDFSVCEDGKSVLATINGGANNVVIDLTKEGRYFANVLRDENDEPLDKDKFLDRVKNPQSKVNLLSLNLKGLIGTDVEKASMWDGHIENMTREMKESIIKNDRAYMAKVISSNKGGFVVEVANTIPAFMPGAMASANRLRDYDALVGTEFEVMVENFDSHGFVVSRKKYLRTIIPSQLRSLRTVLKDNRDMTFEGTVTDIQPYGIFVEMDGFGGCLTGMIHKTLMDDTLREALREREVKSGDRLSFFVHKIEKFVNKDKKMEERIIFSNVPYSERQAVIQKREAEDQKERNTYVAKKTQAAPSEAPAQAEPSEQAEQNA